MISHETIEKNLGLLIVLTILVVSVGGLVQIVPLFFQTSTTKAVAGLKPYTPLQLSGRDIYIREGCVGCHSQMVRPFRSETERYGEYSKVGEYVYDHPFLWGSKRTGPDLHRVGSKYPDAWHYNHMEQPESTSSGSIMPPYPWLLNDELDLASTASKIDVMRRLGVPYPRGYEARAEDDLRSQAETIAGDLQKNGVPADPTREIIALIAYLQRLGTDIRVQQDRPGSAP